MHAQAIGFLPLPVLLAPPTSSVTREHFFSAVICSGILSSKVCFGVRVCVGVGWAGTLLKTAKQGRGLQGMGELMGFEEEGKGNEGELPGRKSYMWERGSQ